MCSRVHLSKDRCTPDCTYLSVNVIPETSNKGLGARTWSSLYTFGLDNGTELAPEDGSSEEEEQEEADKVTR